MIPSTAIIIEAKVQKVTLPPPYLSDIQPGLQFLLMMAMQSIYGVLPLAPLADCSILNGTL